MIHGGWILIILVAASIIVMAAIEYTYSASFAKRKRVKERRMHARGICYALLCCLGLLILTVVYALLSRPLRAQCRSAGPLEAVPQVTISRDGGPFQRAVSVPILE